MNILLDKIKNNVSKVNKILDLSVQKRVYTESEFKPNINGEVKIFTASKGNNVNNSLQLGKIEIYRSDFRVLEIHRDNIHNYFNKFNGSDGKYCKYVFEVKNDDIIKISNQLSKNSSYIIDPTITLNNKDLKREYIKYFDTDTKKSSGISEIASIEDDDASRNLEIGKIYNYKYVGSSPNGQKPSQGGKIGSLKFKYLELKDSSYIIDILSKEPDGVAFPHGMVLILFKLDIQKINFDENKYTD